MSNTHLRLMATLSNKIANFFTILSDICINYSEETHINNIQDLKTQKSAIIASNEKKNHQRLQVQKMERIQKPENNIKIGQVHQFVQTNNDNLQIQNKKIFQLLKKSKNSVKDINIPPRKKGRPRKILQIQNPKATKALTSSYLLFFQENKQKISAKYNVSNISDLTQLTAMQWKKLSKQQKDKYSQRSNENQGNYVDTVNLYKKQYVNELQMINKKKVDDEFKIIKVDKKQRKKVTKNNNQIDKNNKNNDSSQSSSESSSSSSSDIKDKNNKLKNSNAIISIQDSSSLQLSDSKKDESIQL